MFITPKMILYEDMKLNQWRTQKMFMGIHSVAYGGYLYLVCAVVT